MSGQITSNVFRGSGVIAATAGGLSWDTAVVTGSTVTVEAGNGYFINTTSNTCTITLPSSAEVGDQIVFIDYLRTWGTNKIIIDSNGLNYQGDPDTYTVEYNTDGETLNIVYADATKGWIPLNDDDVTDAPVPLPTQLGLFAFGYAGGAVNMSNLVNSSGVVATDRSGVGTAKSGSCGVNYGGDKAIIAYSQDGGSNLISNSAVISTDVTTVGSDRGQVSGCPYGYGKALFVYGYNHSTATMYSVSNHVNTSGVIGSDVTGVGTSRYTASGSGYGGNKGIVFGGHKAPNDYAITNLISDVGVVSTDVAAVSGVTARAQVTGATYGTDKAIVIMGYPNLSMTNLISNTGVLSADVTGVGTGRTGSAMCAYGGDKAINGFGAVIGSVSSLTVLISNTGVASSDVTGVGTARDAPAAAGYSFS